MENIHYISDDTLTFNTIQQIIEKGYKLALSDQSKRQIHKCRNYLDQKMETQNEPIYGINTGFGALYNKRISKEDLGNLQKNLVMSHACGTGDEIPSEIVKLMILLKIQSLSYGHSGIQLETVERLIDFFNHDILPVVYQYGSLGASGDLAPLAHLCLPMLGMGEVTYKGERISGSELLKKMNWKPINLKSKEGLALPNGTQFMGAYGVSLILNVRKLSQLADVIGAVSLDAFDGRIEPFYDSVHQ